MQTKNYDDFIENENVKKILAFHLPRWSQLPSVDLYMDQVLTYINNTFKDINVNDDIVLTKSMINNYVKNKIIKAPDNKKYDKTHLVYLTVIMILKDVFSINDIKSFITMQEGSYSIDVAYDYFCKELENVLVSTFTKRQGNLPFVASHRSSQIEIVRSSIISTCNKLFAQSYIKFLNNEINKNNSETTIAKNKQAKQAKQTKQTKQTKVKTNKTKQAKTKTKK